jgi:ribosomal protein S19E (S16A)
MHLLVSPADCSLVRAKELLEWLKRYHSPMALREIYRNGPKFVRSASVARELLNILIEHGWVKYHEGRVTTADGKVSKENYAIVTDV